MIDRHRDGIAAYCKPENKASLGFVEGLNDLTANIQLYLSVREARLVDRDVGLGLGEIGVRRLLAGERLAVFGIGAGAGLITGGALQLALGLDPVSLGLGAGGRAQLPGVIEHARYVGEGVALNQFINVAVAEKPSALRTEDYFRERAARGDVPKALEIPNRAGVGNPPMRGDGLDE